MVVVEFTFEEMKDLVNIPKDEMVEMLSNLGAPSEWEPETKKIITELTPNRPDWYSMEGLARALRAYWKKKHPEYVVKKSKYEIIVDPSVAKVRPYTAGAVVKGLEFNDQRIRDMVLLQEKLLATLGRKVKRFGIGIYPFQEIEFPVKYLTMNPKDIRYVPLGYEKEMDANEILDVHKKGQEYGHLIKDHKRFPVFIDAKERIMALIPVVNSAETGKVDESCNEIFIEVTGNDLHICKAALNILVCTFADMGGDVFEVTVRYKNETVTTPELKPVKMKLDVDRVNNILGLELKEKEMVQLLERMGYDYKSGDVLIPPYRADIIGHMDIVEDVAIAYGYNNFEPTIPDFFSAGCAIKKYDEMGDVLKGMGFLEVKTFILTNKDKIRNTGYLGEVVEILNPNTQEYTTIRPNILADMLDIFATNKMRGLPQKFYEIGIVQGGAGMERRLVFGIMDKEIKFSDVRGYLQTLGFERGIEIVLVKKENRFFDDEISCSVVSDGKEIGVFGKVRKEILEKIGVGFQAYVCELSI